MKRKLLAFILTGLITILSATCFAFPNEPNGFRNLHWGETMGSVMQKGYHLTYAEDFAGGVNYTAKWDTGYDGVDYEYGLPIAYANFFFIRSNGTYYLEGVSLLFPGYHSDFSNLGNTLTNQYGAATNVNTWAGKNTTIYITEDYNYHTISAYIYNTFTLSNIMLPSVSIQKASQPTYQSHEKTIQEQIDDAKNLTPQQLLDNPVRVVTPQEFYYRTVQYAMRRGIPEDRAYQMAEDMTMQYEARYNMKFRY